jgi:putative ABC transport system permease protein
MGESSAVKLYRRLLRLYPAAFHENYAASMERAFRDEIAEAGGATAGLWLRLARDLAISIPLQLAREAMQDTHHAFRLWAKRPLQTAFAIAALAIGIGANVGVFSVVNALLLRSLPFREPEQLVEIHTFRPPHDTAARFDEWRGQSAYLADAALVEETDATLGSGHKAARMHVAQASSNFFSFLGTQIFLGRSFEPGEDVGDSTDVAVIGYGLWQSLFAGDARVLGSKLRLDDRILTVVGVASPGFNYPNDAVLWKAASYSPGNNGWSVLGRLKPGISLQQAEQALILEADRLAPNRRAADKAKYPATIKSLRGILAGPVKRASPLLMGGVALILLLACANVANLLMARTADRFSELSIRSALGASAARITQQLLTESLLLSLTASVAGLVVAQWTVMVASKIQPAALASQSYSILDARVLGFAMAAAICTGLLFGILPSLHAGRVQTLSVRGASGTRSSRWIREGLVAVQVMLTIILLAGSVAIGRAFFDLTRMDRGYDTRHVATVSVSLQGTTRQAEPLAYFEEALERLRRIPGVQSVTATDFLPLDATMFLGGPMGLDGRPAKENVMMVPVLPDYFQTMGGRILYGREISAAEVRNDTQVAVVNERFASEFGSAEEALGHEVTIGRARRRIVGVVKDMDYKAGMFDANSMQIFIPGHKPGAFYPIFAARVDGRAEDFLAKMRATVESVDDQVPVFGATTMEARLARALLRPKFLQHRSCVLRRLRGDAGRDRDLWPGVLRGVAEAAGNGNPAGAGNHCVETSEIVTGAGLASCSAGLASRRRGSDVRGPVSGGPDGRSEACRFGDIGARRRAGAAGGVDQYLGGDAKHCRTRRDGDFEKRVED